MRFQTLFEGRWIFAILFTDLFDSLSTFIGVAEASGLTGEDGRPINLRRGLIVDALATLTSGLAGTSPGTAYVESIAGIRMGARTGRASVVTAVCFVPCFFLGPLAAAVPAYATAPVLVLVGASMFQSVATIDFSAFSTDVVTFGFLGTSYGMGPHLNGQGVTVWDYEVDLANVENVNDERDVMANRVSPSIANE